MNALLHKPNLLYLIFVRQWQRPYTQDCYNLKFWLRPVHRIKLVKALTIFTTDPQRNWHIKAYGRLIQHREDGPAVILENGTQYWYQKNRYHRLDGPAIINNDVQYWYKDGVKHREDGPAKICANGYQIWYLNGKKHRENGPAIIWPNGALEWYQNDIPHREDGPAGIEANGSQYWFVHGKYHRVDGPAVIDSTGTQSWWINGTLHREHGPAVIWANGTQKWVKNGKTLLENSPLTYYDPHFLDEQAANELFKQLNVLDGWAKREYKGSKLNRETIVFAIDEIVDNPDKFPIPEIWGNDVTILRFPKELQLLLDKLEKNTGAKYNIALGNRYLKAKDKIAQHSDNEEFGNTQSIASISLGVPRMFHFKSKKEPFETTSLLLEHGSLLFMGENCQENYTHGMKNDKITNHELFKKTRINVTFRVWNY